MVVVSFQYYEEYYDDYARWWSEKGEFPNLEEAIEYLREAYKKDFDAIGWRIEGDSVDVD